MIVVRDLSLQYGPRVLFAGVGLNLNPQQCYALVGANGSGKSSFLRILGGEEEPTDGEVVMSKSARIGWLKQDHFQYESLTLIQTVIAGRAPLWDAMQTKDVLLQKESLTDAEGYQLADCEHTIADHDGYTAETRAGELLTGLGFPEARHHDLLSTLSGGYKLRVLLAQTLFNQPDVLLLDEPTNHLDLPSIQWLETYLKNYRGVLVFISHDVAFMNNLATHVLDIDYGEIRPYTGNYDRFLILKEEVVLQKEKEIGDLKKKQEQLQRFIDRFRAGTRARQAASREKALDRVEWPDLQKSSRVYPKFQFLVDPPSGRQVLKVEHIHKAFGEKSVLSNISFTCHRGDKIIFIGPNGIGKSTLLKILLGQIASDQGSCVWGASTSVSYFSQDHHELLKGRGSVFEWLMEHAPQVSEQATRSVLGQVLFTQDDAHKSIQHLSGGEAARLLLARIMLEKRNVIVLDEPTNHLDIEAKASLQKALVRYQGTLLMVTHDRDFAAPIAQNIIKLTPKGAQHHQTW